jgi:hypothetical protein
MDYYSKNHIYLVMEFSMHFGWRPFCCIVYDDCDDDLDDHMFLCNAKARIIRIIIIIVRRALRKTITYQLTAQ